jgi:hypothetical protein
MHISQQELYWNFTDFEKKKECSKSVLHDQNIDLDLIKTYVYKVRLKYFIGRI